MADSAKLNPVGLRPNLTALTYLVLGTIFFASGFAALIYQITWQRALFTIFGVNVEAATVVVTGFLLGLGLGSLAGGWLSRTRLVHLLVLFGMIELSIGAFGVVSLQIFSWAGQSTINLATPITTAVTIGLLVLPTLLMGATLPILAQYLVLHLNNVGRSVGLLYFLNTFGSAVGCFFCGLWIMNRLGMQGAVNAAAAINISVGACALIAAWSQRRDSLPPADSQRTPRTDGPQMVTGRNRLGFAFALTMSVLAGYISLSFEIVWFRAFMIGTNLAPAFAMVLGAYLAGLAFGSLWVRHFCTRDASRAHLGYLLSLVLLISGVIGFVVVPLAAMIGATGAYGSFILAMLLLVFIQTAISGAAFPLLCHIGVPPDDWAGVGLSHLYLGNIVGSVSGTLLTGFVLMDFMSTPQINLYLTCLTAACAIAASAFSPMPRVRRIVPAGLSAALIVTSLYTTPSFFDHYYERITHKGETRDKPHFVTAVENKSGVITIDSTDTVYGGGMYDGVVSVDLIEDHNLLIRPLSLSLFHPQPREVLMIGLATGAWAQILAGNPYLEKLTIIEINPGYLELMRQYPAVSGLFKNPKVEIIIDDGRRWMNRNRDRKFDAIIQNTTWYFRPNITNLLSVEYLRLSADHLHEGGVVMFNTTGSARVQRTGCSVFPYALRVLNVIVGSTTKLRFDEGRLRRVVEHYQVDGKAAFNLADPVQQARVESILESLQLPLPDGPGTSQQMESCSSIQARTQDLELITDDNMGEEWNLGPIRAMYEQALIRLGITRSR